MSENISVKRANTKDLREAIFSVRRAVFVVEQKVSEKEEYDQYETSSTHLVARIDNEVVGTCRFRNTEKGTKLERFAVLKEFRGKNVGRELLICCLDLLKDSPNIYLHAQVQVVDFYAKYGFVVVGEQFEEAGIKHYKMLLQKSNKL